MYRWSETKKCNYMKQIFEIDLRVMVIGILSLFPSALRANDANPEMVKADRTCLPRVETQQYLPILEMGKKWVFQAYTIVNGVEKPISQFSQTVIGKTMDEGREVFMIESDYGNNPLSDGDLNDISYAYEEDGVLWLPADGGGYAPMIDISMEVGDKFFKLEPEDDWIEWTDDDGYFWSRPIIKEKTRMPIEGEDRYILTIDDNDDLYYWIEGIWAVELFYLNPYPVPTCGYEHVRLQECWKDGSKIFDYNSFMELSSLYDVSKSHDIDSAIYDLYGRKVDFPQKGHIYIRNGRKVVFGQ